MAAGRPRHDGVRAGEDDPSTDPLEVALLTLLERHPDALVGAVGGDVSPWVVPIPESVPVDGHRRVDAATLLDVVTPADRVVVAKLWGQARAQGAASAPLRLAEDPDRQVNLYFLDLRYRHGVMVVVFAEEESAVIDGMVEAARIPALPPRFARAHKDAGAVLQWVDPALTQILGWSEEEMLGHKTLDFIHRDDHELAIANWMEMLDSPGPGRRVRLRHRHRDGSWVWLEVINDNRLSDPEHGDVLAEMIDISEEMSAHEALRVREQLLAQLTETVPVGLFHTDLRGNLLFSNRRFHEIIGTPFGSSLADQLQKVVEEDRPKLDEAVELATNGTDAEVEIGITADGDTVRHCLISVRPLLNESGVVAGLTGCVEDVTDTVLIRRELEARAATDPLTGCLNRAATLALLQELLDRMPSAAGRGSGTAVIFMDLDRFKPVNDRLGHAAGDELLARVAERLSASVRVGDVVGRFGGDEFVVVCPGVPTPADALKVARAIAGRAFSQPVELDGEPVPMGASCGVAWTDAHGAVASRLVEEADAAMYESKRLGGAQAVVSHRVEA
ncbi:MAG TPA: sensor domain-containing diguanylate cyclase [Acidimicrobiales bacterium]|nr:sensor domain-containing diguanylate cyclase [Acidimicrobiales bacterium]